MATGSNNGYIALHRKIQDNFLWKESRKFSKAEAWIDILMEARHSETPKKVLIGNKIFICGYGESLKSTQTWAERWGVVKVESKAVFQAFGKRINDCPKTDPLNDPLKGL